jgi:protein involved in polysaccharide export with SLBB domain
MRTIHTALLSLLASGALVGCGSAGLVPPERHPLLESAGELRRVAPSAAALPRELSKVPTAPYVVESGDVLLIQPVDLDSPVRLPGDQPVLCDGTIDLGKFGRLSVVGKTVDEIETLVKSTVQAQTKEDVGFIDVRLVSRVSKVFYILGEVNAPGSYPLTGRETVLDGLTTAGGLTDRAACDRIILSRPSPPESCRLVLPVCYRNLVQLGDTSTNYQLQAGDRVFVPSKTLCENLGLGKGGGNGKCASCPQPCTTGP